MGNFSQSRKTQNTRYIFNNFLHIAFKLLNDQASALYKRIMKTKFNIIVSADEERISESAVLEKSKTERPSLYKVLLLNDDYTPMDFVVEVLRRFFGIDETGAIGLMLTVHNKGAAVVGVFTKEIAETKVMQVMNFSKSHGHPLQCIMEKED